MLTNAGMTRHQVAGVTLETAVAFFTLSANELPPLERRACQLLFGAQLLVVALLFVVVRASRCSQLKKASAS